jgi:DNA repair protein SbcC/Rad50
VRLHALGLRNFRQHVDTQIRFAPGLTGIIGANGAGKTTILEAIAWALYGNSAARGTRDSLRHARAPENAPVRVELDFELAGHRYRVERTLRGAELFLDGGPTPIARSIKAVNELLQRRLGMSRAEFFNTYFTGQKELDVMAALGPTDRARFLARVLGYDRLTAAQELLREQRRTVIAELSGLRSGMPDPDAVALREREADQALAEARDRAELADAAHATALERLATIGPVWEAADAAREQWHALDAERRLVEQALAGAQREQERLASERAGVDAARDELTPLLQVVSILPARRAALEELERLAAAHGERRALSERIASLDEERARLADRLGKLESAPALEVEQRAVLEAARRALSGTESTLDEARTAWARDRQEAETRHEALNTQHDELAAQQATLEGLGAESPCPTCARPLGASYHDVLALITEQLDTVRVDRSYFRNRARQLATVPEPMAELEQRRLTQQQEVASAERRYARINAAVQEREQLQPQYLALQQRLDVATQRLDTLPDGYDAEAHQALRAEAGRLGELATRVAQLQATMERAAPLQQRADAIARDLALHTERHAVIVGRLAALAFDAEQHATLRHEHAGASHAVHQAELAQADARGAVQRAEQQRESARRARTELHALQTRAASLEAERSLHDELDDEFGALRGELNARLRPELSELASGFLESLTDGRYAALELDEDYAVQVLEDGLPKSVLSGGEEDLCNLVLRLAISQMIAERAGQEFSLLILDEVFGSLDESRRENVLALLRRLHDRFEQVMVITHIEDVREGLDRVLMVTYDAESGSSRVHASAGGAAGADAAAWNAEAVA